MPRVSLSAPRPALRWKICALLFFATTINYLDRQILSLVKPILDARFHWSNTDFGWINAAFQGAYGVGLLGFGWLIDRVGSRLGYAIAIVTWSAAAMAHSLAGSLAGFTAARIALGLGEGGNFPAAIKTVGLWFTAREKAFATGLFNSGSSVGAILAPILIPSVALAGGWQAAFIVAGLLGFIWVAFWWTTDAAPPRSEQDAAISGEYAPRPLSWGKLLGIRQTWAFLAFKFILDPVVWFFLIWLPDFFKQTRGLEISRSWVHLATIYTLMTVVGIAGSWISGALIGRGWTVTRARKSVMLAAAIGMLGILGVSHATNWGAVGLVGFSCGMISIFVANMFSSVSDIFPSSSVASVVGLGGLCGCVSGMIFPVVCGRVLDHFRSLNNISAGYTLLFAICALGGLAAFILSHLFAPKFAPLPPAPRWNASTP